MLAAGLDLFGTKGYADTTVEEVCRRAYVSSRNFYEEFDNRLGLLVAVGERIVAGAFAAWTAIGGDRPGPRCGGAVSALVHTLVDDPRVARVAFIETVGIEPAHEALRREMLGVFPAWLQACLQGHVDDLRVSPEPAQPGRGPLRRRPRADRRLGAPPPTSGRASTSWSTTSSRSASSSLGCAAAPEH